MDLLNIIALCVIVFIAIFLYYQYLVFWKTQSETIREILYKCSVSLRSCYNIRELRTLKPNFSNDITKAFCYPIIKSFVPASYKISAVTTLAIIDERLKLLELAGLPLPKIKDNEEV